jgi:uncharacterized membrane protein YjgN (DUF898 family)
MIFYKKRDTSKPYDPDKFDISDPREITRVQMFDDGLSFSKGQQWTAAYYTLLIQGAIFAFHTVFNGLNVSCSIRTVEIIMSFIASGFTAIIGWGLIDGYSDTLREYRYHINKYLGIVPKDDERVFEKYLIGLFRSIFVASFIFVAGYIAVSSYFIINPA